MTKVTLTGLVGSFVLILAAALPVRAEVEKTHPCIVLVGVSQCADPQIRPRPHAEDDAKALYDLFTSKDHLGVAPDHVRLLLGQADAKRHSQPATHQNIVTAIRWAADHAGTEDLVILGLIMQGAPLGDRTCYFASDSTFKDRAKDAVGASEIEAALEKLKSRKFCAFLDVNFKGFKLGKGKAPEANLQGFYKEFLGSTKEEAGVPPGRILFLANAGLKPTVELEKHGLFAQALLNGLQGAADKEGYEPDGIVTVDELVTYLNKEIPALAKKAGKADADTDHNFFILGGRSCHFELSRNPAVAGKVKEQLDKFNKLAKEQDLSKDMVEEGRKLLGQMPKLEAYRNLRKKYQQLAAGSLTAEQFKDDRTKLLADMKLDREVARAFAAKVIHASDMIHKEYVKSVNQGDLVASAIKGLYRRIDEKIPDDIKERMDKAKSLKEDELTTLLTDVRERLGRREDLANHKDIDYALQRMMSPLDPYTTYIDPDTVSTFKRETSGNFTGIGIQIRMDTARDQLKVVTPIKDSPAYKAGLQAGDVITEIRREYDSRGKKLAKPEIIPTKGLAINEAVNRISGMPGTRVKLVVEREGVEKPLEFEIRRGEVEVETVLGYERKSDDSWDYVLDRENGICYVRLTQFSRYTERDLRRVLRQLQESPGIKGFILDLRFNPGGLLTSAVNISDMFIDDGLIVTVRPRVGEPQIYAGEHEGSLLDFPMVCLVNGHSASGSEIVAACLQDQERAVIVGERSYGKGSVQNIQPFEKGQIKLTVASFWRPNGRNLNKSSTKGREDEDWGVLPNKGYTRKLTPKQLDELEIHLRNQEIIQRPDRPAKENGKTKFKDVQLDMALKYLSEQIKMAARAPEKKAG
jgi:C-terminal peptidase prc